MAFFRSYILSFQSLSQWTESVPFLTNFLVSKNHTHRFFAEFFVHLPHSIFLWNFTQSGQQTCALSLSATFHHPFIQPVWIVFPEKIWFWCCYRKSDLSSVDVLRRTVLWNSEHVDDHLVLDFWFTMNLKNWEQNGYTRCAFCVQLQSFPSGLLRGLALNVRAWKFGVHCNNFYIQKPKSICCQENHSRKLCLSVCCTCLATQIKKCFSLSFSCFLKAYLARLHFRFSLLVHFVFASFSTHLSSSGLFCSVKVTFISK